MQVGLAMQVVGLGALAAVVATHVAERFEFFPSMGWGIPNSPGHYLDLLSAILGLVLLPLGFALRRLARRQTPD
jgi:ABC-type nickel/cobalt efflux system permease component RcnA